MDPRWGRDLPASASSLYRIYFSIMPVLTGARGQGLKHGKILWISDNNAPDSPNWDIKPTEGNNVGLTKFGILERGFTGHAPAI